MQLQIKKLEKVFSKDKKIQFSDVSVPDTSVLFVDGPSGAGKTTLLKILAKLDEKYNGSYSTDFLKQEIGYFFHDYRLIQSLSIEENILFGNMNKSFSSESLYQDIKNIAKKLGIDQKLGIPVSKLSSGQYQRVCLVRAFIGNKRYILLDEPTSHLDEETAVLVYRLILEYYNRGVLFVISSHDMRLFHFLETHIDPEKIYTIQM